MTPNVTSTGLLKRYQTFTMRCKCFVIDPFTRRRRKCLNKNCKDCPTMCAVHVRQAVIKIQRAYRGYRTRCKLIVFQKLPSELWDRVLYFTRYQHKVQTKFRESVLNVFDKKILKSLDITPNGLAQLYSWPERHQSDDILNHRVRRAKLVKFFDENDLIIT